MKQSRRSFLKWMGIGTASVGAALIPIKLIPDLKADGILIKEVVKKTPETIQYGDSERISFPHWELKIETLITQDKFDYIARGIANPHDKRYPAKYFAKRIDIVKYRHDKSYKKDIISDINIMLENTYKKIGPNFWGNKMISRT